MVQRYLKYCVFVYLSVLGVVFVTLCFLAVWFLVTPGYFHPHPEEKDVYEWLPEGAAYLVDKSDRRLTKVGMRANKIKNEDILRFKQLPKLRSLELRNTGITDEAIPYLNELTSLEYLDLSYNPGITKEGLRKLDLPNLIMLDITHIASDGQSLQTMSENQAAEKKDDPDDEKLSTPPPP